MSKTFETLVAGARMVEFNPAWCNRTGYFNHAVEGDHVPSMTEGEVVTAVDPRGRRLVIVGGHSGNVCVFERYSDNSGILCANWSGDVRYTLEDLTGLDFSSSLSENHLAAMESLRQQYLAFLAKQAA